MRLKALQGLDREKLQNEYCLLYTSSERQRQLRGAEIESGLCLVGAHKDDLLITINGADARSYACLLYTSRCV